MKSPVGGDDLGGERGEEGLDLGTVDRARFDGDGLCLVVRGHVRRGPGERLGGVVDTASLEPVELAQVNKDITFWNKKS